MKNGRLSAPRVCLGKRVVEKGRQTPQMHDPCICRKHIILNKPRRCFAQKGSYRAKTRGDSRSSSKRTKSDNFHEKCRSAYSILVRLKIMRKDSKFKSQEAKMFGRSCEIYLYKSQE